MTKSSTVDHLSAFLTAQNIHNISRNESVHGASGQKHTCKIHGRLYRGRVREVGWWCFVVLVVGLTTELIASGLTSNREFGDLGTWMALVSHVVVGLAALLLVVVAVWRTKTTRHLWLETNESQSHPDGVLKELCDAVADVRAWKLPIWVPSEAWFITPERPSDSAIAQAHRAQVRCFLIGEQGIVECPPAAQT